MLFSEYYGAYFACVAEILSEAVEGTLTKEKISEIAARQGLGESVLTIPANLRNGNWPLITPDCKTPVRHIPPHPTTLLQKRWLKTLLLDPRIRLFDLTDKGLEDVAPLFDPAKIVWYDRYCNGDSFEDEDYIERFRQLLEAVTPRLLFPLPNCLIISHGLLHGQAAWLEATSRMLRLQKIRMMSFSTALTTMVLTI